MSLKKMSIDRHLVYDLYQNIDFQFAHTLLSMNSFPFHHIPNFEEIVQVLDQVEYTNSHRRGTWTVSQEKLLNLMTFGICMKNQSPPISLTQADWERVSQVFDCHNWKSCRNQWLLDKQIKASWTAEEDRTLIQLYNHSPKKWCEIAIDLWKICKTPHIRQGKQCRDRWVNKLDPNIIKLPWSRKEELRLFEEVKAKGKRWAEISQNIFDLKRTENTIKNRFYNMLKQEENKLKLKKMTKDEKEEIVVNHIIKQLRNQTKVNNEEVESKKEPNSTVFDIRKFSTKYLENCEIVIFTSRKLTKLN